MKTPAISQSRAPAKAVSPPLQGSATALQDAGVDALPPTWKWTRLKFVAEIGNGSTPDRNNAKYWSGEGFPWLNSSVVNVTEVSEASDYVSELALKECHLPVLSPLTVLVGLTGQGKTCGSATLLTVAATINQHLAFVAPIKEKSNARYLRWLLVSKYHLLREQSSDGGSTKGALTCEDLKELPLPLPPLPTQRAIAAYLDRETARLDELVKAKAGLLELVAEKRRALITHAVTRGLNPRAPLRDSGIPWLGSIPKHWGQRRAAFLFYERDERGRPEHPLLEVSINRGVVVREFSDDKIEAVAADLGTMKVAYQGDIVFNKMRMWQGAVGVSPCDGLTSPDYVVAHPVSDDLNIEYAKALFRTPLFSAECARHSNGITWDRLRLYWEGFRDIWIPLPPLTEQKSIVAHLQRETAKLDALAASAAHTMTLLKERRAALISAAVTGEIAISE